MMKVERFRTTIEFKSMLWMLHAFVESNRTSIYRRVCSIVPRSALFAGWACNRWKKLLKQENMRMRILYIFGKPLR